MNRVIYGVLSILIIAAVAVFIYRAADSPEYAFLGQIQTLVCESGQTFRYVFADTDSSVMQLTVNDTAYQLKRIDVDAQALYQTSDASVLFWDKGDVATLEMQGTTYTNCTAEDVSGGEVQTILGTAADWINVNQNITADWKMSLQAPTEVQIDNPQSATYGLMYIGPEALPDTEITDGFMITITAATNTSLSAYLAASGASTTGNPITFNGYEAHQYQKLSQLGDMAVQTTFVLADQSTVIDIAEIYYGPQSQAYEAVGTEILETLDFTQMVIGEDISHELITITAPETNDVVTSPITVSGEARGQWFFEASFPLMVVDWNGRIIGEGYATAQEDWMTEDYVSFTGEVSYDLPADTPYKRGAIIFQKSNASGLPEHDDAVEMQVVFE